MGCVDTLLPKLRSNALSNPVDAFLKHYEGDSRVSEMIAFSSGMKYFSTAEFQCQFSEAEAERGVNVLL